MMNPMLAEVSVALLHRSEAQAALNSTLHSVAFLKEGLPHIPAPCLLWGSDARGDGHLWSCEDTQISGNMEGSNMLHPQQITFKEKEVGEGMMKLVQEKIGICFG